MKVLSALAMAVVGLLLADAMSPAIAQRVQMEMLDRLEHGKCELRFRDDRGPSEPMCLSSGRQLIQLRHKNKKCQSVIVDDKENEVTAQYTCPGHGYGRTNIRLETDRLIQIDSQGVDDGVPFAFAAEARRIGECSN